MPSRRLRPGFPPLLARTVALVRPRPGHPPARPPCPVGADGPQAVAPAKQLTVDARETLGDTAATAGSPR